MGHRKPSFKRSRLFVAALALAVASALAVSSARAQGAHDIWTPDGNVYATARAGNILYFGGFFSHVGPSTGSALLYVLRPE